VPVSHALDDLPSLVNFLFVSGVVSVLKVEKPERNGRYLYVAESHCFSGIDNMILDTDDAHPLPVRSMHEIGFDHFDICYSVKRAKKRKMSSHTRQG